jgi:predicted nucleic acid-binding Zn finger protein
MLLPTTTKLKQGGPLMVTTSTINPVKQIEALHERLEKARQIVAEGKVHPIVGISSEWVVQGREGYYLVNGACTCVDSLERSEIHHGWCKHKLAVEIYKGNPDPKARAKREKRAVDSLAAEEALMHRTGHYVPGDASPGDDGHPLAEQVNELFA